LAGLIAVNGKLYGETTRGGVNCNCGTLYVLTPKKRRAHVRRSPPAATAARDADRS
jgi:uncharacterized repeat protein (TIGR03803 family)